MTLRKQLCAAVLAVAAFPVFADCHLPPAPSKVPDGASATKQQMVTAMQTLQHYNGDVNVYLKCLDFEARRNRLSAAQQESMHNSAVATLQRIAAQFNAQVRVFKAKSG